MSRAKKEIRMEVFEVTNVRELEFGVLFDLTINGVKIYSCKVVEGKHGDFISFPSYKGKNGKYYTHCYFDLTDEETAEIIKEVDMILG